MTKTRHKKTLTSVRDPRRTHSIRFAEREAVELQIRADRWTNGNVSEYVRFASLNFAPKSGDFKKVRCE